MIAVTAASGKLGGLVLEVLLKAFPPGQLVALARSPEKLAHLAARGVKVRRGDYSAPETLGPALAGVKRLLLISGMDLGQRVEQHRAVIEAAKSAGVELTAHTSLLRADVSTLPIAEEHRATEKLLRDSHVPFVLLRNGAVSDQTRGCRGGVVASYREQLFQQFAGGYPSGRADVRAISTLIAQR